MIDLKKAITNLVENGVDFVIVGGVAINLHSSAYITRDLDICYSRTNQNIKKLVNALKPFEPRPRNFPEDLPFIFDDTSLRSGTNFTFETTIGDIDLLGEIKGIGDYNNAAAQSLTYIVYGVEVKALNLNALIESKTAANRPKDQLVLPELLALREALDPNAE
jgi:predicted nucleotidyltransferase